MSEPPGAGSDPPDTLQAGRSEERRQSDTPGRGPLDTVISPDTGAPAEARRVIGTWLDGHPRRQAAVLAISEIVTNAVRHGSVDTPLEVKGRRTDSAVRVSVHQSSEAPLLPVPDFPPTDVDIGRGLAIVTAVADRWGVRHDDGLTVWFEIAAAPLQDVRRP